MFDHARRIWEHDQSANDADPNKERGGTESNREEFEKGERGLFHDVSNIDKQ